MACTHHTDRFCNSSWGCMWSWISIELVDLLHAAGPVAPVICHEVARICHACAAALTQQCRKVPDLTFVDASAEAADRGPLTLEVGAEEWHSLLIQA